MTVQISLVSPNRPFWDFAELFLWIMAVSTIGCASYWSAESAKQEVNERYRELDEKVKWTKVWIESIEELEVGIFRL